MNAHIAGTTMRRMRVLLGWVLILGIFGILYFLAYDRLHVRAGQLVEITIYPLLVAVFLWELLRYKATKTE